MDQVLYYRLVPFGLCDFGIMVSDDGQVWSFYDLGLNRDEAVGEMYRLTGGGWTWHA